MSWKYGDEDLAKKFAAKAHADQKYGDQPYTVHLAAVRAVLSDFGLDPDGGFSLGDLCMAAWLHDVLEDTPTTAEQLELTFGSDVTKLVWAVTGEGANRKERVASAYRKIAEYPKALVLKLADRIANAEASAKDNPRLLTMYRGEYPAFKNALGRQVTFQASGYNEFKRPMLDAMWARLDKVLG